MKNAYLDCQSGISGDMFLAACVDAGADLAVIQHGIDSLGTGNCRLEASEVRKNGFRALKIDVHHQPEHAHRHLHHIEEMIANSSITERQKHLAVRIFRNLAKAEARVHGSTLEKVHFHEVGAIDSIADIVGGAVAFDLLGIDRLFCSPIPVGNGQIKIAHGTVSLPAPATAELLRGVPVQQSSIQSELTTPTGAAIVSTLVAEFGNLPSMTIESIGIGAGTRDLDEQANLLRLLVGQSCSETDSDSVVQLDTNLDDVSPEWIGWCQQKIFEAGALDVFLTHIQMKKNRPGVLLSVLCSESDAEKIRNIVFEETGTLGIRSQKLSRAILPREPRAVETGFGSVSGKVITLPSGRQRFSPEFDACAQLAEKNRISIGEVYRAAELAFRENRDKT